MILAKMLFKSHLEDGEKLVYVAHRHIITLKVQITKIFFVYFLTPGAIALLMPFQIIIYICAAIMFVGLIKSIYVWADWYFDAWLVTDRSVVEIRWSGIFNRSNMRIEYHAIKGVSYQIVGFLGTILNFGTTYIEIYASNNNFFQLEKAASPRKLERAILSAQAEFIERKTFQDHESLKEMLAGMIQTQSKFNKDR